MVTQTRQAKIPLPRRDFFGTMKPRKLTFPRQTGPFSSERRPHLPDTPLGDTMTTIPMPLMNKLMTQSPTRKLLAIAICGLGTLSVTTAPVYADDDGSFWTQFVPSADTRLIFVSSEEGNDNNSGLNPNAPVKTLARGYELLRDGYPDWMLLKRGDVWYESFPDWNKDGRSSDEYLVVGAYGNDSSRPQIRPKGDEIALHVFGTEKLSNIAFVGLHIEPVSRTNGQNAPGIRWLRECENILFEDLMVAGFKDNILLQAYPSSNNLENLRINGCVIVDSWSTAGHSQGLFAQSVNGLTIENSVFDSNGFNEDRGIAPTKFNHNAYIQSNCENVVVLNNMFANASGSGIQLRSGGILHDNLFLNNPSSYIIGSPAAFTMNTAVEGHVSRNVAMYGRGITDSLPLARGAELTNVGDILFTDNIFYQSSIGYNGQPIMVHGTMNGGSLANITIADNWIIDWNGSVEIQPEEEANTYESIRFEGNHILAELNENMGNYNFNKPMISSHQPDRYTITFDRNSYYHYGIHNRPFKNDSSNLSIDEWRNEIEPNGLYRELPNMPSHLDISDYLASINMNGDLDSFRELSRDLSRTRPQPELAPQRVYEWMRAQLAEY